MKKNNQFRLVAVLFAFTLMLASMSSCNRGTGCPNKFETKPPVSLFK